MTPSRAWLSNRAEIGFNTSFVCYTTQRDHDQPMLPPPRSLQQPKQFIKTAIGACVKAPATLLVYSADAVISVGSMAMLALSSSRRQKTPPRELELAELASNSDASLTQNEQGIARCAKNSAEAIEGNTHGSVQATSASTGSLQQSGSLSGAVMASAPQQSFLAANDAVQQAQFEQMEVQDRNQWETQWRRQRQTSPLDDPLMARPPSKVGVLVSWAAR